MAVNFNTVSLLNTFTAASVSAPLIEGTAAATLVTIADGHGPRFTTAASQTGRQGFRVVLPSALDFTGYDWRSFTILHSQGGPGEKLDTTSNGGIRLIFIDASGNYAGYNLYGYIAGINGAASREGFLVAYTAINYVFHISADRAPDISSGAVNWAAITAYELTAKTVAPWRTDGKIFRFCKRNAPQVTGTETFTTVSALNAATSDITKDPLLLQSAPRYYFAAAQVSFNIRIGLDIGNGLTATSFVDAAFAVCFDSPFEIAEVGKTVGPWVQLGAARTRAFKIVQSAADVLDLSDGSFSSAGWWQWELSGSGVATCTRVQFWRFNGFAAAHGSYIDCAWNEADTAVEVTATTVITGGLIRGAKATGLKVLGAAGVYSNLDLSIDSLVGTYDIELGAGGAGTYELPNITVPAGRTLRVRNNSASNAVVVVLPPGTVYSATTAGGSITVVSAGTKLTITDLPPGCDAVVLTAGTSTVLAQADELPGATFVFEYTGAPVVDIGIFKPGYKPRYLRNLQLATSDSAIPVSLEIDRSYLP